MTRLLFATDFHGLRTEYDALVEATRALSPDAVVLGGDLLPFHHDPAEDLVEPQRRFLREDLREVFGRIRSMNVPIYGVHGNDDWAAAVEGFEDLEAEDLFRPLHGRALPLDDGRWIAGLGLVPVTPFFMCDWDRMDHEGWTPAIEPPQILLTRPGPDLHEGRLDDIAARPTIETELGDLAQKSDPEKTIYVVHTPPSDCALAVMHGGRSIGSVALRRFLETHRPPVSLHGHVHESPQLTGAIHDTVGTTLCINPGAAVFGFRGAVVDVDARTVERVGAA